MTGIISWRQIFPLATPGLTISILVAICTLVPPMARADLLIRLEHAEFQASRVLIRPPRARLESADDNYRLYDADMDAMVTALPGQGVFYEEDPAALARATERFAQDLRQNRERIQARLDEAPEAVRERWQHMVERWRLDAEADVPAARTPRIETIEPSGDEASAGGFRCEIVRIGLGDSGDRMRACLASPDSVGASPADLETLTGMFRYLERLRQAAGPAADDAPAVPPGLIAHLIERTGKVVLGAARWNAETGTGWQVEDLWSAALDGSRFTVADEHRRVATPYAD